MDKKDKWQENGKPGKKSSHVPWIIALLVIVVAAFAISCSTENETGKSFNLKGKETRPLLDPAMFTGQTRMAYTAAHKYAEYLNEVYCYCYCDEPPFHHKSLLSCFTDKHGAG